MVDYAALRKIINASGMSVRKARGGTRVADSRSFRAMPLSRLEQAQELVASAARDDALAFSAKCGRPGLETLSSVSARAQRSVGAVLEILSSPAPASLERAAAAFPSARRVRDSIVNPRWSSMTSQDPSASSLALPNIYLSPWEASSLYSQKGLFELVINKKSKSIMLNGCCVENARLSRQELDAVNERLEVLDFKGMLSDSTLSSLVYGGALVFPMFKKDTPATTPLPLSALLRLGVLDKGCVDYFVSLDRWNTFIIPPYNPTQKDFLHPDAYTVPFLGSDVHFTRCARVVTARQAGYWGQVLNQGWGISDLCGYLQSGMNYKVAVQSLPLMIQQMSILARVVNVDGVLATEGANALDALVDQKTIRTREASPDNPVTMDVLGDIKSINRNFQHVPELLQMLRQDVASDAALPEPLLWSSQKGNFSSGDDTNGNLMKQNESVQMIHKELEVQYRQLAKVMVIDALGADRRIIEALPYTQVHFDQPVIANAVERAEIGKLYAETAFNLVSARVPVDIAVEMADRNVSSDMRTQADVLERLHKVQEEVDERDRRRSSLEMEQMKAEIEAKKDSSAASQPSSPSNPPEKEESKVERRQNKSLKGQNVASYSRLEQKQHEFARRGFSKRSEALAKKQGKKV